MSHRTVIEINHDYLHRYKESPELWATLWLKIAMNDWEQERFNCDTPGIRKVGERHHSETLKLTIK